MFKTVNPPATFTAEARITIPGATDPGVFQVEWRYQTKAGMQAWIKAREGVDHLVSLGEVMVGWSEVLDADEQPLPFSREALAGMLDTYPAAGRDLIGAYIGALFESRLGN